MSDSAKWYVVHTYSGYENKVAQNLEKLVENRNLQSLIHEVRVPTELVVEQKDDTQKEVERKMFPGGSPALSAPAPSRSPSPPKR